MNKKIARVVVDVALDREFDYLVPDSIGNHIHVGTRVNIPFGRTNTAGYVVGFLEQSEHAKLKEIISVIGNKSFIDEQMLELAKWMGRYYCVSIEQAIKTVLPGPVRRKGAGFRRQMFISLKNQEVQSTECPESGERKAEGKGYGHELSAKQKKVLEILKRSNTGMFLNDLVKEVGITAAPVKSLEKKGFITIIQANIRRDPFTNLTILPSQPLQLMAEQEEALRMIKECVDRTDCRDPISDVRNHQVVDTGSPTISNQQSAVGNGSSNVVLLYGVTGSGKTEVYLQAIDYVLKKGKGAIVLVPEISLTPQTVERFVSRFGNRIAVLHSHLSDGERHDEWHRINDGKANIVVGARSAVFAPVKDLGLIVVDEEHEPSYKQEEAPRYNARDVAVMRGMIENCPVVLGSATPSLESWFNARKNKYKLAKLPIRADGRKMPMMRVIDMRIETERSGHASVFSKDLLEAIRLRLERTEQTILFLNRRGYATSIICPKCGYVAKCDQCSLAYTYHRNSDELRCHICGARRQVPARCPECKDPAFKFTGIGTQRVENILLKFFPHARIQRIDSDITTSKDSYDRIFGDFRGGKINILIGTQMIAKGLHFPNVTLVGVIYADLSLHIPDFRAGERTFQLLAQVAGRAGRGEVSGEVIVQTYTPFHTAIQAARRVDFEGFCDQEIEFRRELNYPPFSHLVCLTFKGRSESSVSFCAVTLLRKIKPKLQARVIVSDVIPAPLARAKGFYRYQIMLRCSSARLITV
ncbi:MAG: primosomal protein N', partial [Kiritimatiellae bacterium]|nr:primosomal protein N' [Kiritimatiellia bacterium]